MAKGSLVFFSFVLRSPRRRRRHRARSHAHFLRFCAVEPVPSCLGSLLAVSASCSSFAIAFEAWRNFFLFCGVFGRRKVECLPDRTGPERKRERAEDCAFFLRFVMYFPAFLPSENWKENAENVIAKVNFRSCLFFFWRGPFCWKK